MVKEQFTKYGTLLSLYVAQAIPMSFFSTVVPVIMRQEEYSLESIGLIQLVKLPWILKFLWAPYVDSKNNTGRDYKRWIIISEIFYAMIILSIGFLDLGNNFITIIVLMVIAFTASATQDIATDAFAILSLQKKERSLGNSMQSSGSFIGTLMGSGVLLVVYHQFGWKFLLIGLAAFVTVAILPVVSFKKKTQEEPQYQPPRRVSLKDVGSFFRQQGIMRRVILLAIFYSGIIGILTMIKPYLVDINFSVMEIGLVSGVYGTSLAILVALLMGQLIKKWGRRFSVRFISFLGLIAATYFLWLSYISITFYHIFVGVALVWGAYGASSVIIYTIAMDTVRKGREGTDFTLQIVITHLSSLIIAVSSGKVADLVGYNGLFAIETIVCILVIIATYFLYQEKREIAYAYTT
ncbi:MAG: MFS transporter [Bacteroidales bacterium]|nr:MFS transporter [Bacteroidales bacterium]MCF8338368.1 MFS transporter [Bacteroidales bacterium]